jgi:hypothetical protein
LRRLFQHLQLHVTIDYIGLKKTHPRYPTQWDVSVRILEDNPLDGGLCEVVVHQALATRATFAAGRDDAARRALSAWCYEEAHHLTNSVWGDLPRRRSGAVGSEIPMANETLGARYAMQVGLVAAINTNLDDTLMELGDDLSSVYALSLACDRCDRHEALLRGGVYSALYLLESFREVADGEDVSEAPAPFAALPIALASSVSIGGGLVCWSIGRQLVERDVFEVLVLSRP